MTQILHICQSCVSGAPSDEALAALQASLTKAGVDAAVRSADCLGVCKAPTCLSLQDAGRASYVFSSVDLKTDTDDIIATCQHYAGAEAGWIEDARACGRLRNCLVARLPALGR